MAASKTSGSKEKLQEDVLNSLQSIISSCGGECDVDTLSKDYKDLVGSYVPVRQFNQGTLSSFLLSLPKIFVCTNRGGRLLVRLKSDKHAPHIAKLAKEQKATRKIKSRPKQPARRPVYSSWMPAHDIRYANYSASHGNWREPYRGPFPTGGGFAPRPRSIKAGGEMKLYTPPLKHFGKAFTSIKSQAPPRRPDYPPNAAKNVATSRPTSPPVATKSKSSPPNLTKSSSQETVKPKPLLPLINVRPPLLPTPPIPRINPSALYYNDGNFSFPRAIRDNQEKQYAPYFENNYMMKVPPRFKKSESKPSIKTFKQTLEEEVKHRGMKQDLVFRSIPCGKKAQHWVSVLNINGTSVSSYPEEFSLAQDAEEFVARKALEMLKAEENKNYPVTADLQTSIERVKKILGNREEELLWIDSVQDMYKESFNEVLPDNWTKEVEKYNKANNIKLGVLVDNPVLDRWTVQLKTQGTPSIMEHLTRPEDSQGNSSLYDDFSQQYLNSQEESFRQEAEEVMNNIQEFTLQDQNLNVESVESVESYANDVTTEADDAPRLPSLELPMSNFWDVYVTYIEDFTRIHFRLIGDIYSTAYDDMVTEMELHYMEDKNMSPVPEPKIGHIYAASYDNSWCRVKVLSISGNDVRVHFVDHGDVEDLTISQLHDLHEQFFKLPAQGVCCSLAGLECGGQDQKALNLLQNMALGQTLVAQVVSRDNSVSLILFNTSTEDDVNINEKVSEQIVLSFVDPILPPVGGVAEVYLIHATSTGDVYVQIETETYKVLQNLLELARSRTEEMLGEDVKIDLTRLYLARFSEDGEWYRAVPRGNVDPNGKVQMWFVDFGNLDQVPTTSIRPLEVNDKLNKIPHQALLCRLHNVPPAEGLQWTSQVCQRIIDLIPDDSPLLLKVHASGTDGGPPVVELFKRIQPQNQLVSINATLSMDESLFSPGGDSNNNSLRKEVILSPTRMRNRRSSSNSITSGSSGLNSGPSSMTSQHESTSRASSPLEMSKRFHQPGSLLPVDMPSVGEYFDVYITYAASPSNFAVQPWKMRSKVSNLMSEMQAYYSCQDNVKANPEVTVGTYFAVKHSDNCWYRAYLTMANEGIVSGLFVDYGDCFVVTQDCVQPLPPVFRSLPCQAIKAKLAGVAAANMDWRPEDSFRFKQLVEDHELVSIITNIEQDKETSEYVLSLRLVDTSDPQSDRYIDDILVIEKRAVRE